MSEETIRVLLIEDNEGDARLIREMLRESRLPFDFDHVTTLATGLDRLAAGQEDVALLDLGLPDSQGLDSFRQAIRAASGIPILVMTGLNDETLAIEAVHEGAQDYLVKGQVDGNLLARSIRYAIERKRADEQIRKSESLLKQAQEIAQVGSWEWELATNELTWSEELYRIFHVDPASYKATFEGYVSSVHPEDRSRVREAVEKALVDHLPYEREERIVLPDGTIRTVSVRGEVIVDAGDKPIRMVGTLQDVTERKQVELELVRTRDAALQSVKLKSAFLANMSHEIRTPLNIILGYNAVIAEDFAKLDEASRRSLVDGVQRAGHRLMATIDGILDISKIETRNFEVRPVRLELRTLIERQIEDFHLLAREQGLDLSSEIDEPEAAVSFDEYSLSHALMNLLQNAIKFTRKGSVSVKLGRDEEGRLCIAVRDTGIGMDASYLPRLFEPFSQEESGYTRRFEGSGLGLALTKKYLELNEAEISVQSRKGEGSTFCIHFAKSCEVSGSAPPVGPPAAAASPRKMSAAPNGEKLPILVVEDDPDNQAYMKVILDQRFEVLLAASGEEARRHLQARRGALAMILMDLSLRGNEDGLTLTRYVREQEEWKDIPILVTTAHAFPEDRSRAMAAGCSGYIAKPFGRRELLTLIDDLISASRSTPRTPHSLS